MGGQTVLEWSIMEPELIRNAVIIAANAEHSPWGKALNAAQRMAIESDPNTDIDLSGYLDNTDTQTLSFSNPNLSITGGNSVDISGIDTDTRKNDKYYKNSIGANTELPQRTERHNALKNALMEDSSL